MKYEAYFKRHLKEVEKTLGEVLSPKDQYPAVIHEAMRYAIFPGGKRFRPVLTLASCEAVGGTLEQALIPAAALELIHGYSLVHDDLPALDNDDFRRGKPTCHKKFGEAMAVLTGDALLTLAFQILSRVRPAPRAVRLLAEISTASGTCGMIGGQVADITVVQEKLNLPVLDFISIHKTGKLIKASAVSGAIAGGASVEVTEKIRKYGEFLGLAFQAIDDLVDGDGYIRFMKPREVRQKARDLIANAKREIRPLGRAADKLHFLADFLLKQMPRSTHAALAR